MTGILKRWPRGGVFKIANPAFLLPVALLAIAVLAWATATTRTEAHSHAVNPPENVEASTTSTSLTLTWEAPVAVVNCPVEHYLIRGMRTTDRMYIADREKVSADGPLTFTVTGLDPGILYIMAIRAVAEYGHGKPCRSPNSREIYAYARTQEAETATNTPEPTATNTPEPTSTNTPEPTATNTPEPTSTNTPEPTATNTPEPTATNTPEPTATNTPEPTATNTPEPTATNTPEPTATNTPEPTATNTPAPTNTPEPTATNTPEPTATNTPEPTATNTPEPTSTNTPAPTNTPEPTSTNTPEPTATNTPAPTNTPEPASTNTPEPTATNTPEPTATNTPEPTATNTPEPTATNTPEPTATNTPEPTATNTPDPIESTDRIEDPDAIQMGSMKYISVVKSGTTYGMADGQTFLLTVNEGDSRHTNVPIDIKLSGTPSHDVSVRIKFQKSADSTATGRKDRIRDFRYINRVITWSAGASGEDLTKTINLRIFGDTTVESDEKVRFRLLDLTTDDPKVEFSGGESRIMFKVVIANDDSDG